MLRGKFIIQVQHRGNSYRFNVAVIRGTGGTSLLAREVAATMGLISRVDETHEVLSRQISLFWMEPVKIKLKEGFTLHCIPTAKKDSFPVMEVVKAELYCMIKNDIITPYLNQQTGVQLWCQES